MGLRVSLSVILRVQASADRVGSQLNPDALTLAMHAPPDDAVCIHREVRSRATMGIHFATFAGSEDEVRFPNTVSSAVSC